MSPRDGELKVRRPIYVDGQPPKTWLQAYAPPLAIIAACMLVLDGCRVVKGIFEVGFGVGVIVVVAIVAVIGGVLALVMRK